MADGRPGLLGHGGGGYSEVKQSDVDPLTFGRFDVPRTVYGTAAGNVCDTAGQVSGLVLDGNSFAVSATFPRRTHN